MEKCRRRYNKLHVIKSSDMKTKKMAFKPNTNKFDKARSKSHKHSKYTNLIAGRITKEPSFFKGGLTSETIYRKNVENTLTKAVIDNNIQTFLTACDPTNSKENISPLNFSAPSTSVNLENMSKNINLNSSRSSSGKKSSLDSLALSRSDRSSGTFNLHHTETPKLKENRSAFKTINEAYSKYMQEESKKAESVKAATIEEKSTQKHKGTKKDPVYPANYELFNSMNDYGEIIVKNTKMEVEKLERKVYADMYSESRNRVARSPVSSPLEDMFSLDDVNLKVPQTQWSYSTPPGQRIKPIVVEATERKPYLWVGADEGPKNKNVSKNITKKKSDKLGNNEIHVISNNNFTKKPSGLYEFAADIKKFSKCSVVNLDAHCKPVFQIVSKKGAKEKTAKKIVFNDYQKHDSASNDDDVRYNDRDALYEFLAATQRRPTKQKRQSTTGDLFPKKLSFSSADEEAENAPAMNNYSTKKTYKRRKTDENDVNDTDAEDLGCVSLAQGNVATTFNYAKPAARKYVPTATRKPNCDTSDVKPLNGSNCTISKQQWLEQQQNRQRDWVFEEEAALPNVGIPYFHGGIPGYDLPAVKPQNGSSAALAKLCAGENQNVPFYEEKQSFLAPPGTGNEAGGPVDRFFKFRVARDESFSGNALETEPSDAFPRFNSANLNESFEGNYDPVICSAVENTPRMQYLERGLKNMDASNDDAVNSSYFTFIPGDNGVQPRDGNCFGYDGFPVETSSDAEGTFARSGPEDGEHKSFFINIRGFENGKTSSGEDGSAQRLF